MKNAFELLFQMSNPRKVVKSKTDAKKEFLIKDFQKILKSHGVLRFVSHCDKKAAVVENLNRTREKIWTYFTAKQTNIYIAKLQDFVKSYNHSVHRIIGMRAAEVRAKFQDRLWAKLYGTILHKHRKASDVGKIARISKIKGFFEKCYVPKWHEENFHNTSRIPKGNRFSNWETSWVMI